METGSAGCDPQGSGFGSGSGSGSDSGYCRGDRCHRGGCQRGRLSWAPTRSTLEAVGASARGLRSEAAKDYFRASSVRTAPDDVCGATGAPSAGGSAKTLADGVAGSVCASRCVRRDSRASLTDSRGRGALAKGVEDSSEEGSKDGCKAA